jgi:hypothetical protein
VKLRLALAFVLCASAAAAAPGDYYLYAPQSVGPDASAATGGDGVVVKEITIRRGDTLSEISRAFNGRASYFPQILLFNQISDPDLIYAGRTLRVPVAPVAAKQKERAVPQAPVRKEAPPAIDDERPEDQQKDRVVPVPAPAVKPPEVQDVKGEQGLYEKAVKAYRGATCADALPLLDSFLTRFPASPLAPDVGLLRADCHLRLSQQLQK